MNHRRWKGIGNAFNQIVKTKINRKNENQIEVVFTRVSYVIVVRDNRNFHEVNRNSLYGAKGRDENVRNKITHKYQWR